MYNNHDYCLWGHGKQYKKQVCDGQFVLSSSVNPRRILPPLMHSPFINVFWKKTNSKVYSIPIIKQYECFMNHFLVNFRQMNLLNPDWNAFFWNNISRQWWKDRKIQFCFICRRERMGIKSREILSLGKKFTFKVRKASPGVNYLNGSWTHYKTEILERSSLF